LLEIIRFSIAYLEPQGFLELGGLEEDFLGVVQAGQELLRSVSNELHRSLITARGEWTLPPASVK
jgi:hypothetical protein